MRIISIQTYKIIKQKKGVRNMKTSSPKPAPQAQNQLRIKPIIDPAQNIIFGIEFQNPEHLINLYKDHFYSLFLLFHFYGEYEHKQITKSKLNVAMLELKRKLLQHVCTNNCQIAANHFGCANLELKDGQCSVRKIMECQIKVLKFVYDQLCRNLPYDKIQMHNQQKRQLIRRAFLIIFQKQKQIPFKINITFFDYAKMASEALGIDCEVKNYYGFYIAQFYCSEYQKRNQSVYIQVSKDKSRYRYIKQKSCSLMSLSSTHNQSFANLQKQSNNNEMTDNESFFDLVRLESSVYVDTEDRQNSRQKNINKVQKFMGEQTDSQLVQDQVQNNQNGDDYQFIQNQSLPLHDVTGEELVYRKSLKKTFAQQAENSKNQSTLMYQSKVLQEIDPTPLSYKKVKNNQVQNMLQSYVKSHQQQKQKQTQKQQLQEKIMDECSSIIQQQSQILQNQLNDNQTQAVKINDKQTQQIQNKKNQCAEIFFKNSQQIIITVKIKDRDQISASNSNQIKSETKKFQIPSLQVQTATFRHGCIHKSALVAKNNLKSPKRIRKTSDTISQNLYFHEDDYSFQSFIDNISADQNLQVSNPYFQQACSQNTQKNSHKNKSAAVSVSETSSRVNQKIQSDIQEEAESGQSGIGSLNQFVGLVKKGSLQIDRKLLQRFSFEQMIDALDQLQSQNMLESKTTNNKSQVSTNTSLTQLQSQQYSTQPQNQQSGTDFITILSAILRQQNQTRISQFIEKARKSLTSIKNQEIENLNLSKVSTTAVRNQKIKRKVRGLDLVKFPSQVHTQNTKKSYQISTCMMKSKGLTLLQKQQNIRNSSILTKSKVMKISQLQSDSSLRMTKHFMPPFIKKSTY